VDWPGATDLWKQYLGTIIRSLAERRGDAFRGRLWIKNELPLGKGMGSSTALVIGVSRALLGEHSESEARTVENIVNVGNSGMDFAVIWAGRPIVFQKDKPPSNLPIDLTLPNAVLIDTGSPEQTTMELVAWLREREDNEEIANALEAIGHCTERLLEGESALSVFPDHHRSQVALGMVPPDVQRLIADIEDAGGAAKVIGAGGKTGGAGMVLAIHPREKILDRIVEDRFPIASLGD
jgi:mevalonate kinase